MYKLFLATACALAFTGCSEMPQQDQHQVSIQDEPPVTGSMIVRRKPKAPAAPAQAESGSSAATSANQ